MPERENSLGLDVKRFGIKEVEAITARTKINISKLQEIEKRLTEEFKNGVIEISKVDEFKKEIGYTGKLTNLTNWINRRHNDGELKIRATARAGKLYLIL